MNLMMEVRNNPLANRKKMTVTLTEKAEFRLRAFLKTSATQENQSGVRISVKKWWL